MYSEKPLAASFAGSPELATAAGSACGSAALQTRSSDGRLQTCRALIDDGRLGDIVAASAFVVTRGPEWHHPNPAFFCQSGGGPVLNPGPYHVTALLAS